MTEVEAAQLVTMLTVAFPNEWRFLDEKQQEMTRKLWRRFLVDLPYPEGDAAITRAIATCKRQPSIAEVRGLVLTQTIGHRRSGAEAYGDLRAALGREPVFVDPIVQRVIDAMGWRNFCNAPEGDAAFRARFIDAYDELAEQERKELQVGQLAPPIPRPALRERRHCEALSVGDIVGGLLPEKGSS